MKAGANGVVIAGNDARGTLFGAGWLLRRLHMERQVLEVDDNLHVTTAPRYPLRGHQLGYRPKGQHLRRLDAGAVGAVHPRPGGVRHERGRADSAAIRRRRRQPALSRCRRSK